MKLKKKKLEIDELKDRLTQEPKKQQDLVVKAKQEVQIEVERLKQELSNKEKRNLQY